MQGNNQGGWGFGVMVGWQRYIGRRLGECPSNGLVVGFSIVLDCRQNFRPQRAVPKNLEVGIILNCGDPSETVFRGSVKPGDCSLIIPDQGVDTGQIVLMPRLARLALFECQTPADGLDVVSAGVGLVEIFGHLT